jgi:hypothetical protein
MAKLRHMGRGLSDLQKTMLTMQPNEHGTIYIRDVITAYYGWTQHKPYNHFSKKEIGEKKYISAYIAIRKSLKRLEGRGLIWYPNPSPLANNHSIYTFTQAGREVSAKLYEQGCRPVKLRYLREVVISDELRHPKGEIIEVSGYDASRMLICGLWEVV